MKKTIIALLSLAGVAMADAYVWDANQNYSYTWDFSQANTQNGNTGVLGGTVSNTYTTEEVTNVGTAVVGWTKTDANGGKTYGQYWETSTNSFLYNAINAVTTTSATLTLTLDYYWTGAQWGENILHIGANDTGVAFGLSNGYMSVATGTANDEVFSAAKSDIRLTANAWNSLTFTLSNNQWTVSCNGVTSTASTLGTVTWANEGDKNDDGTDRWGNVEDERNKYSIGVKAPGWNSGATGLNDSGCKIANMTISYTVPEPATATLSLLALCGLAARRRRK